MQILNKKVGDFIQLEDGTVLSLLSVEGGEVRIGVIGQPEESSERIPYLPPVASGLFSYFERWFRGKAKSPEKGVPG